MDRDVSAYLVKLRREHPFLATLSLYMSYQFTAQVEQFSTDGRTTRLNPSYFGKLTASAKVGTLLHLTLHSALLHPVRCGNRIEPIWNVAADIVVNQMIVESSFEPPPNTAVEPRYADLSVEQVYAKLLNSAEQLVQSSGQPPPQGQPNQPPQAQGDNPNSAQEPADSNDDKQGPARSQTSCESGKESTQQRQPATSGGSRPPTKTAAGTNNSLTKVLARLYPAVADLELAGRKNDPNQRQDQKALEAYWKGAITKARTVEMISSKSRGSVPAGLSRAIDEVLNPQLDWRTVLWRFMSKTPCDYSGFDRRFIHQGLYLDQLEGESLTVYVAIDTSGSINDRQLAQFRAEVETIARCYVGIKGQLYFVDADVYGPYPLTRSTRIVDAEGGGGTDFTVLFDKLMDNYDPFADSLCIYLTDGDGTFPETSPPMPVLWVATDDSVEAFPFGEVTRLTN